MKLYSNAGRLAQNAAILEVSRPSFKEASHLLCRGKTLSKLVQGGSLPAGGPCGGGSGILATGAAQPTAGQREACLGWVSVVGILVFLMEQLGTELVAHNLLQGGSGCESISTGCPRSSSQAARVWAPTCHACLVPDLSAPAHTRGRAGNPPPPPAPPFGPAAGG